MAERPATISFWEGRLPHWEVEEGKYFLTLHLTGAIPEQGRVRIRALADELETVPADNRIDRRRLRRHIFREMEAWLDRAATITHLYDERVAKMVMEAISFRAGNRVWKMLEYVVMPNHLHLFFELLSGDLKSVIEGFKRWTGHRAGEILSLDGDRFWQREWFDHWSRSDEESEKIAAYIKANPVKAGLVKKEEEWPYGSFGRCREPSGTKTDPNA